MRISVYIYIYICENVYVLYDDIKPRVDMYVYVPICEYMYPFIVSFISVDWIGNVCANSDKG